MTKISALPAANVANDTDQLEVNQAGVSRRVTVGQINAVVASALPSQRTAAITYYVSTVGSDANDGTSAAIPVLTFQKALNLCSATAAYSAGPFTIQAAAGTYTVSTELTYTRSLFVTSEVTFRGADVSGGVPTTIVQGSTDGTRTHGFFSGGGSMRWLFYDIKFQSFGTVLAGSQHIILSATNVHCRNCTTMMSLGVMAVGNAFGGDWDGRDLGGTTIAAGVGLRVAIGSFWNFQQTSLATGLLIHHYERGLVGTECVSGHLDRMRFHDCDTGIELTRTSGAANMTGIQFLRCGIGLLLEGPIPNLLIANDADFGQGTADACTTNIVVTSAPTNDQIDTIKDLGQTLPAARSLWLVRTVTTVSSMTGSVAEALLFNACSVVRGRVREGDELRIRLEGSCSSGLTAVGTLRLKFGTTVLRTWLLPIGAQSFITEANLTSTNRTDFRGTIWQITDTTISPAVVDLTTIATTVGLVSLTADTLVSVTWQAGTAADTFVLSVGRCYSTIAGLTI